MSLLSLVAMLLLGVFYWGIFLAIKAAYANGVCDALYEVMEPGHPGAVDAREIMEKCQLWQNYKERKWRIPK